MLHENTKCSHTDIMRNRPILCISIAECSIWWFLTTYLAFIFWVWYMPSSIKHIATGLSDRLVSGCSIHLILSVLSISVHTTTMQSRTRHVTTQCIADTVADRYQLSPLLQQHITTETQSTINKSPLAVKLSWQHSGMDVFYYDLQTQQTRSDWLGLW